MNYIDYLKKYDNIDKYVLFLLYIGVTVSQTAKWTELSRMQIYNIVKRNQDFIKEHATVLEDLMEKVG